MSLGLDRLCRGGGIARICHESSTIVVTARTWWKARGDRGTVLSEVVAVFACLETKHKNKFISFLHAVVDTKIDTCKHPTHNVAADFA
mmetsp:Transcript_17871/g.47101  ORF Transcript_17871/g.47101 Transcript_17871/m.47101 type:complete len:88 (-) Transcript_17871:142-405(-)